MPVLVGARVFDKRIGPMIQKNKNEVTDVVALSIQSCAPNTVIGV